MEVKKISAIVIVIVIVTVLVSNPQSMTLGSIDSSQTYVVTVSSD